MTKLKLFLNYRHFSARASRSTNLSRRSVIRVSVNEDNDNVRHVATVASRRRQHRLTNIGKSSSRVRCARIVSQWSDGWLDWIDGRVGVQIKAGFNHWRINYETRACVTTVDIYYADKPWEKCFHQFEVHWNAIARSVQHENDVNNTVNWWSCNSILCKR